jgi:hypothetical protein
LSPAKASSVADSCAATLVAVRSVSAIALTTGMGLQRLGAGVHDASGVADALLTIVRGAYAEGGDEAPQLMTQELA